jgi:hypothetical protein
MMTSEARRRDATRRDADIHAAVVVVVVQYLSPPEKLWEFSVFRGPR